MKKITFFLLILLMINTYAHAQTKSVQLTTYYPAPFGSYDRLRLVPHDNITDPIVCDTSVQGLIIYESNNNRFEVCNGSWEPLSSIWTETGDFIYPSSTLTNPNLKIGIGTTHPLKNLHVAGDGEVLLASGAPSIELRDTDTLADSFRILVDTGNKLQFQSNNTGSFLEKMVLTSTGNVGIGETNPLQNLHIGGEGEILLEDTTVGIEFRDTTATADDFKIFVGNNTPQSLSFQSNNGGTFSDKMVLTSTGLIGVGTNDPQKILHLMPFAHPNAHYSRLEGQIIEGDDVGLQIIGTNSSSWMAHILLSNAPSSGHNKHWQINHWGPDYNDRFSISYKVTDSTDFWIETGAGVVSHEEHFSILTNGNVGIGDHSPDAALEIVSTGGDLLNISQSISNDGDIVIVKANGNVGIGEKNPQKQLHIGGDGSLRLESNSVDITFIDTTAGGDDFEIGAWNNNDSLFFVSQIGSAPPQIKMTLKSNGNLGIGVTNPRSKVQIERPGNSTRQYIQIDAESGTPPSSDCDSSNEAGRMVIRDSDRLYVCTTSGWKYATLN